ncbi:hypothetical protein [Saccharopolyspora endophytica]|uniref:Thioesterase n=1 Tax=Saccharopolyspora endophytica TaxID=543886 RepID=A0ABS5DBB0_9PSEU|nr:hypothetical protein [Saccharopolyspora endophytica]MBQ0923520.1 hypothetical protein [Saccharopolyspora endophytica]
MTDTTPGFDQVVSLPAVSEGTVIPDFIDLNGHMNIQHYLDYLAWARTRSAATRESTSNTGACDDSASSPRSTT